MNIFCCQLWRLYSPKGQRLLAAWHTLTVYRFKRIQIRSLHKLLSSCSVSTLGEHVLRHIIDHFPIPFFPLCTRPMCVHEKIHCDTNKVHISIHRRMVVFREFFLKILRDRCVYASETTHPYGYVGR